MTAALNQPQTLPQTFHVPAISCDHCVSAITDEVSTVDGVQSVDVDLETKTVSVTGGTREAIVNAIDDAGYDIT